MIKIGIELNGVIRDINKQYLRYYLKDINPSFEDTNIDLNVVDALSELPFDTDTDKTKFVYEDYPYELFGCASPMTRNLHAYLNGWVFNMYWDNDVDVSVFSLGEEELTIQSTYFYLSKSGTRVRKAVFPNNHTELWDNYDVIITCNPEIINSMPKNKISILINKNDNAEVKDKAFMNYNSLEEIFKDEEFIKKIENNKIIKNKYGFFSRIFTKIKCFIRKIG